MEQLRWPPANVGMAIRVRKLVKEGAADEVSCAYRKRYGEQEIPLYVDSVEKVRIKDDGGFYVVIFPSWLPESEQGLIVEECLTRGLSFLVDLYSHTTKACEAMWEAMKSKIKPRKSFYNDADLSFLEKLQKVRVKLLQGNETEISEDLEEILNYEFNYPPRDRREAINARVLCLLQLECHIRHSEHPQNTLVRIIPDSMLHAYLTQSDFEYNILQVSTLEELVLKDDGGLYLVMPVFRSVDDEVAGAIKDECELRFLKLIPDRSDPGDFLLTSSNKSVIKQILFASRAKEEKDARAEGKEPYYIALWKTRWPTDDLNDRIYVRSLAKMTASSLEVRDKVRRQRSLECQMEEKERVRLMVSYMEDYKVEVPLHVTSTQELIEKDDGGLYLVKYPSSLSNDVKLAIQNLAYRRQLNCVEVPELQDE